MAKGNLLLGTAKNSVGDVVMYRREGAQITRVRVRNVKNPKTNAQSFQRAIMAPIAKFYSPLSVVLERSFEGLSKAKSHNKFNQVNAGLARENKWCVRKGVGFTPFPYQVSQGTLPSLSYKPDENEESIEFTAATGAAGKTTIGHLSELFVAQGYKNGDVVTIILCVDNGDNTNFPAYAQFEVNTQSEALIGTVIKGIVVTISGEGNIKVNFSYPSKAAIAGAIIIARFDGNMWRRSTQSIVMSESALAGLTSPTQVAAAIASYGPTAGDGNPLVYLDGDELKDGE